MRNFKRPSLAEFRLFDFMFFLLLDVLFITLFKVSSCPQNYFFLLEFTTHSAVEVCYEK